MEKTKVLKGKIGLVVSDRMNKTVVVAIENRVMHKRYKKIIKKTSKFKAHDEKNKCKVGDKVRIVECRPLSKGKRTRVVEVIERAKRNG
ncbi:MAG: 30S ribosomal protein S17 [Candidatus Schekmanbacteria bacterium RIFCSPHIGHO2_02_FULL_38_11]|uniref:Small ribosomal subunit protein uS17 n=1 Tax=Candidatus Schekmanbacteria bacterium RIFCSPLOWO2_12_FULL_38_15 TaxID=1817883 RepID=A0A1F7SLM2_9BACT|nr:MAG: 30S ribosomal protein S17 [Candidatus Schekmanbacteria bacterium GWA2_38_9]OGL50070.1 MAG: 30S ribosomal protein S17 [Candidatus Schekmanbacteria bacterium RIFCSPLOWO2_02_FULL_38_14]OGL50512.1 MAG: 30S ribosomal protein S17 [Candidatus Schekmanbacteria bacterium RIFCSPHIGHO2_02_FULL_38_11]OGL54669.1 MAG: 30S ribosomal protein S17 [Candidatus Schekmanbacteria bacterium RIFCSPLOWO2_12_FULL_38_15]